MKPSDGIRATRARCEDATGAGDIDAMRAMLAPDVQWYDDSEGLERTATELRWLKLRCNVAAPRACSPGHGSSDGNDAATRYSSS